MKTLILIMSTIVLGLMGVGCSKSKSNADANNITGPTSAITTATPVIINNDTGTTTSGGDSTVTFVPASFAAMSSYVNVAGNLTALNNPQNIKISFNIKAAEAGRYGGDVTISYIDNGIPHTHVFTAGLGRNSTYKGLYDNNRIQADYNYWFNYNGELVFTGFFEDTKGAITLTLTPEAPAGGGNDAEPFSVTYKGSISFKNYTAPKTTPYRSCWFIYTGGVGDCRSNVIQTKCGLSPGVEAGYTVLGTFTNVSIKKAFNLN